MTVNCKIMIKDYHDSIEETTATILVSTELLLKQAMSSRLQMSNRLYK